MREPAPETLRTLHDREVRALRDSVVFRGVDGAGPSPARDGRAVFVPGQHFDVLARPQTPRSSHWAIWWSDLMMTMFILFAALYAFQMPKMTSLRITPDSTAVPIAPPIKKDNTILARLYAQGREILVEHGLESQVSVRLVPETSVRFIVDDAVLFERGTAKIRPASQNVLGPLATVLRRSPYAVSVVSHVPATERPLARYSTPWELASARSGSVIQAILSNSGIAADTFVATGYVRQIPHGSVEIILSAENPTAPLPEFAESPRARQGVRQWMGGQAQGGL